MTPDDTIAALATPPGEGGIGIIRISGPEAFPIAIRLFRPPSGHARADLPSHRVLYGFIVDPDTSETADEVLLIPMKAPKSYTREDVVEISCHGGMAPLRQVFGLVLRHGARAAEPGEFTQRAFLNGRIDLTQAEAVLDVINSRTELALHSAMDHLRGGLAREVGGLQDRLRRLLAMVEASVDFPEEDIELLSADTMRTEASSVFSEVVRLLGTYEEGRVLREGVSTAIVGRPNVGKSSLLNALLKEERAIVTDIPGTTRDTLEETVDIGGLPIRIIDTAGIRETHDLVEQEGVRRSLQALERADLALVVIDASQPLHRGDKEILDRACEGRAVVVLNKTDLGRHVDEKGIDRVCSDRPVVAISAKTGAGLEQLREEIVRQVFSGGKPRDAVFITRARHRESLQKAGDALRQFLESLSAGMSGEFLAVDLQAVLDAVGEISGETTPDDILDIIFREFCIGK